MEELSDHTNTGRQNSAITNGRGLRRGRTISLVIEQTAMGIRVLPPEAL